MKHKRWAALGLALFGFSLLGNPTTAVAASKLSSLRTEVSQLKTQRDTLTAAIADLEASATSKTEVKDTTAVTSTVCKASFDPGIRSRGGRVHTTASYAGVTLEAPTS